MQNTQPEGVYDESEWMPSELISQESWITVQAPCGALERGDLAIVEENANLAPRIPGALVCVYPGLTPDYAQGSAFFARLRERDGALFLEVADAEMIPAAGATISGVVRMRLHPMMA